MEVTLTDCTINPVQSIERAASNCYDSTPNGSGKIMNACYNSGHQSVLEFADFTFHISGISRACSHQLVRHRCASYAHRSQRYVTEDNFRFVAPASIQKDDQAFYLFCTHMSKTQSVYNELLSLGVPQEDARFVLPNSCETIIEVKMNGRELIHFCNERLCNRAQWEIRELAKRMKQCVMYHNEDCAKFAELLQPKCYANTKYPFCTEQKGCGLAPKLSDVYKTYLTHKENV